MAADEFEESLILIVDTQIHTCGLFSGLLELHLHTRLLMFFIFILFAYWSWESQMHVFALQLINFHVFFCWFYKPLRQSERIFIQFSQFSRREKFFLKRVIFNNFSRENFSVFRGSLKLQHHEGLCRSLAQFSSEKKKNFFKKLFHF